MMWPRAAKVLALCLLGALCLNLGLVFSDRLRRQSLETIVEPSAVGDRAYFPLPEEPPADSPIVTYRGQTLRAFDGEELRARDAEMIRLGPEDSQTYTVYRPAEEAKDEELKGFLFLKLAEGKFLKLKPPEP